MLTGHSSWLSIHLLFLEEGVTHPPRSDATKSSHFVGKQKCKESKACVLRSIFGIPQPRPLQTYMSCFLTGFFKHLRVFLFLCFPAVSWKTQRGKNQHVLRGTVASALPEASAPCPQTSQAACGRPWQVAAHLNVFSEGLVNCIPSSPWGPTALPCGCTFPCFSNWGTQVTAGHQVCLALRWGRAGAAGWGGCHATVGRAVTGEASCSGIYGTELSVAL